MAAVETVEKLELLLTVSRIVGRISIYHQPADRFATVTADKQLNEHFLHPPKLSRANRVLESRKCRLARQVITRYRSSTRSKLQHRIGFQRVVVVAVLIASRNPHNPLAQHLRYRDLDSAAVATVIHTAGKSTRQAQLLINLPQQQ